MLAKARGGWDHRSWLGVGDGVGQFQGSSGSQISPRRRLLGSWPESGLWVLMWQPGLAGGGGLIAVVTTVPASDAQVCSSGSL